jgi:hypothetical protein
VKTKPAFISVPLTEAAATVLTHWLTVVPENVVPVTHPAERQALADLLTALEGSVAPPNEASLEAARELLLQRHGPWVHEGPHFEPDSDR